MWASVFSLRGVMERDYFTRNCGCLAFFRIRWRSTEVRLPYTPSTRKIQAIIYGIGFA